MLHPLDELKAYVRFGADDEQALRDLLPHVMPSAPAIAGRFYDRILEFPGAAAVFEDDAQVERLKKTLVRWIEQLLSGPWDQAYYELRRRIGHTHVRVRLKSQYMFTAMHQLMQELQTLAHVHLPARAVDICRSLQRIADIELAIMLGTYIEARERGELEGLRDLLVSHLRTSVVLVDKERRVAVATDRRELFSVVEPAGKPLSSVLVDELDDAAQLEQHLSRAVHSGREVVLPRVSFVREGKSRTVRLSIIPLRHPIAEALVQLEDLTDTLAAEERARNAEHLARLGVMAASVAHEIRNPLAGISGAVQFVASSLPAGDPRIEALDEVKNQIGRLGALVGDLLNFSRPIQVEAHRVDLATVARAAATQASAATDSPPAEVRGAGNALADDGLVSQVLLNLVQNAWQAGARSVLVDIDDGRVMVADDGPGIAPEHRTQIFEPFFTTKVRGTGLGLPVAKKIVDAMGGSLTLLPSPLGGAAFEVRLPTT